MDFVLGELCDQVMTARAGHRPMYIVGGGTKSFYGNTRVMTAADGHCFLDMSVYKGVINYHPSELVITVRSGTPLKELETILAAEKQMLAFEPPRYGDAATVGGCVAAGLSGPSRMAAGSLRDFVLGTRVMDAQGRLLSFGGEVVKNVAGFDLSRVMAGSMGVYGALVDVSLKVVPQPEATTTVCFDLDEATAIKQLATWRRLPIPISASAWVPGAEGTSGRLWVRLSGSGVAVRQACLTVGGEAADDPTARAFWIALREQTHAWFRLDAPRESLWRLALPPGTPPIDGLGPNLVEWGGGQRWVRGEWDASVVRDLAAQHGGHATLFRLGRRAQRPADGVFHPPARGVLDIMQRLKNEFDPWHLFNPGRLFVEP